MTQQEQRIALAEWAGWTDVRQGTAFLWGTSPSGEESVFVPDYLIDLNAVHALWAKLERKQRIAYSRCLREVVVNAGGHATSFKEDIDACCENATAAQRCEALCRVLWPDRFL